MNFERLKNNIISLVEEQQYKLGYRSEPVRLYYPLKSLNRLLNTSGDPSEMKEILEKFAAFAEDDLGKIQVTSEKERFCIRLPKEASDFVHTLGDRDPFLKKLIQLVGTHGTAMEQVLELFRETSESVVIEKKIHGEFDYLCFFPDGDPDDFRYCLTDEGCHVIYHRFTPEDYIDCEF